jgi:cell division protein FtsA
MAERVSGKRAQNVWVGLSPVYAYLQSTRATVNVSDEGHRVTRYDVDQVLAAARSATLPPGRQLMELWTDGFIVDGYDNLKDPAGMIGNRLSLEARAVVADSVTVSDYKAIVEGSGRLLAGLVLKPLALSAVLFEPEERVGDTVLIDMGGGACEIGYFSDNRLMRIGAVPVGGRSIASDIALVLKINYAVAARIERELDLLVQPPEDAMVELADYGYVESRQVSRLMLYEIAKSRVEEICSLVARELTRIIGEQRMLDHVIVTGGMLRNRGIDALLPRTFSRKTRLHITPLGKFADIGYNVAMGIISVVAGPEEKNTEESVETGEHREGFWRRIVHIIKDFWE